MDLRSIYQQAQAFANAAAFKQFDRARVAEFLRHFNGSGSLGKYSSGERLLAAWLTGMLNGAKSPQTLLAMAGDITAPLLASDFAHATTALNVPAESLAMLANEIARQARTPQTARPESGGPETP